MPAVAVSVVVATHQRAHLLPRLFAALAAQEVDLELVVVDDASRDGTAQQLQALAASAPYPVHVVSRDVNGGPAAAREDGWRLASAPLVAFTDDDCTPSPGWLAALLGAEDGESVVVGRTVAAEGERGVFSRTVEVRDATYAQTCNVLYPRALLEAVGGFDTRLRTGEDTDLVLRARDAGAGTRFAEDALVVHDVRPSSLPAALREAWSWSDLPGVVAKHPEIRSTHLHGRLWWKPAHPLALLLLAGVASRRPVGLLLALPWLHRRWVVEAPPGVGPRRRAASLPGQLAVDLVETAAMARGSAKHGALVL